jgi:peptidoglycan/xylan/chitin deacetylase (PgdA/CDA1 family)
VGGWRDFPAGIYILAYHGIVDPNNMEGWERAFDKGRVWVSNFEAQMAFLSQRMVPLPLSALSEFADGRPIDRAYVIVTFDDGFTNLLTHAAPVVARYGIRPAVFVNGRFAGGAVHSRVLAAILTAGAHAKALAEELRQTVPEEDWSDDPVSLFHQTKNLYRTPGLIEHATESVYRRCVGDPADLHVHLRPDEVRTLRDAGWEIANHTWAHIPLSSLTEHQVFESIDHNWEYWRDLGIPLVDAVAYPNGTAGDVNRFVEQYLRAHPHVQGLFCGGGVNVQSTRTEWFRMFAGNGSTRQLTFRLHDEDAKAQVAMRNLS